MKRNGKVTATIAIALGCGALFGGSPSTRPPFAQNDQGELKRAVQFERGKYLAEVVSACMECHTPHDAGARISPLTVGRVGSGELMPLTDLPGRIVAPNLTPDLETGAGTWTDEQLARAIREGIGHDGRTLFPAMPYQRYRSMSDEDLASVIVYLRALPPVRNALPATKLNIGVATMIQGFPKPVAGPVAEPDNSSPVARGKYLTEIAACGDCHTPMSSFGHRLRGMGFAGGFILTGKFGRVASSNLTPDPSGIPYYDFKIFTEAMRNGVVVARKLNPIMPWTTYRGMTDEDLAAIFAYLRTVKPVNHRVDNTEVATYCTVCKKRHGLGMRN